MKLNANQAIIFSSEDLEETERKMIEWVGSHPFILSAIDSKGLEFDFVVVVFDRQRKTWQTARKTDATLRMLSELYVAITRAQKRVVILYRKTVPDMLAFFQSTEYDFHCEGAEMVLQDFDTISSAHEWLTQAQDFLLNFQYRLAARCFDVTGDQGMSFWCSAKFHYAEMVRWLHKCSFPRLTFSRPTKISRWCLMRVWLSLLPVSRRSASGRTKDIYMSRKPWLEDLIICIGLKL